MRVRSWMVVVAVGAGLALPAAPCFAKDEPVSKQSPKPKEEPAGNKDPGDGPSAKDRETARNLMDRGDELFAAGDYAAALKSYQAADKIMNVTSTGFAVGKALEKLGRLIEARDKLLAVTRIAPKPNESNILIDARNGARALQDEVAGRIPTVTFKISGLPTTEGVTIKLGDYSVPAAALTLPQRVDPREHQVTASCPRRADISLTFTISEKEAKVIEISFGPEQQGPVKPDPAISPLVFIGFGTAGAGILVGAITGGVSLSMAADVESRCVNGTNCRLEDESKADTATTLAHVSTTSFVLAGVGAGVGVVGLILSFGGDDGAAPSEAPAASGVQVQPVVGLGSIGLTGTF